MSISNYKPVFESKLASPFEQLTSTSGMLHNYKNGKPHMKWMENKTAQIIFIWIDDKHFLKVKNLLLRLELKITASKMPKPM